METTHVLGRTTAMKQSDEIERCIVDCMDCGSICEETTNYCLKTGGKHASPEHIRLMLDCAEICRMSTSYMLRMSTFSARICDLCADVCDQCGESCAQFQNDTAMNACADVCRRCSRSCQEMARMSMK